MKRGFLLLVFALIAVFSVSIAFAQSTPSATVNTRVLNVRSGPATTYAVLTRIRYGESYTVIGRNNVSATWWQLSVNGVTGWVSSRYVTAVNTDSIPVTVTSDCTIHLAPECPATRVSVQVAQQSFERGFMIWRSDTREIYVFTDGGVFLNYTDTWAGESLPQETPPSGRQQPQNGFGKVWLDYPNVRDLLGWATSGETAYVTTIETTQSSGRASGSATYLRLASGQIIWMNYYTDAWDYRF